MVKRLFNLRNPFAAPPNRVESQMLDSPGSPPEYNEVGRPRQRYTDFLASNSDTLPWPRPSSIPSIAPLAGPEDIESTLLGGQHPPIPPRPVRRFQPSSPSPQEPVSTEAGARAPMKNKDHRAEISQLPRSARALLGLEADFGILKSSHRGVPTRYGDAASLELEIVCTLCLSFASECECPSGCATTVLQMQDMPWAKQAYGAYPVSEWLAGALTMRTAHTAAGVAKCLWPTLSIGTIPIFDQDSLVLVRSRAIERCADAREFFLSLVGPMTQHQATECSCGCGEAICGQVALRHDLYSTPEELARVRTTLYQIGKEDRIRKFTAVTLTNGMTCISRQGYTVRDVKNEFVEDYILACTLDPTSGRHHCDPALTTRPRTTMWDGTLNSYVIEMLCESRSDSCSSYYLSIYHSRWIAAANDKYGHQLALRTEWFGSGIGVMVLDIPSSTGTRKPNIPYGISLSVFGPEKLGFQRMNPKSHGEYRDCTTAPAERGWENLRVKMNTTNAPAFIWMYRGETKTAYSNEVEISGPARPGFRCTGACKGGVQAYCCGFAAPSSNPNDISVYIIGGNHSTACLALMQYGQQLGKPVYFVDQKSCVGCTVLRVPPGSIVAGILPSIGIGNSEGQAGYAA